MLDRETGGHDVITSCSRCKKASWRAKPADKHHVCVECVIKERDRLLAERPKLVAIAKRIASFTSEYRCTDDPCRCLRCSAARVLREIGETK